ncbi:MAG: MBOAT family O-acyltransferase [Coriobacteriales bacterium]|jgi:alginate O-acetyltransferase complex protein AlgI
MVFSSLTFICVFLPVVFALHCLIPSMRVRNALLIVASLAFYSYGEPVLVVLMVISTLVNWGLGLLVGPRDGRRGPSKAMLAIAVVVNLAFLCVFKYADMLVGSVNAIAGTSLPLPQIALPIGISFYTFQALSYVIDVYRGEATAQRNYLRVLLYISFFPQLIAGPIIKYHDVAEQIAHRRVTLEGVALGFRRFCVGLGKKVLIANTMAVAVDGIFGATLTSVNITAAWVAAIAYLFQIYFDFSGYSDMAIGMARMFGFEYKENFDHPYASSSVKEFWRRWHISLSTWFKEYVYIPLGGNRHGRPRAVLNKTIVFFLCGLWHGAAWTFVVWGLIHGLFLLIEEYVPIKRLPKAIGIIYTLLVVTVAFVLFRADTFAQGGTFIAQMFTGFHFDYASVELSMRYLSPLFMAMLPIAVIAASPIAVHIKNRIALASTSAQATARTVSYVLALVLFAVCLLALSTGGYNPFIYFRF